MFVLSIYILLHIKREHLQVKSAYN